MEDKLPATKTAVLAGATGLIGKQLLYLLLKSKAYDKVIVIVRKELTVKHPKISQHVIDFEQLASYREQLRGDDYFCCLGTTIKKAGSQDAFYKVDFTYCLEFAKLAVQHQARNFALVSAIGANASSRIFYSRVKGELENALTGLPLARVHIFQPSILVGDRFEFRLGEKLGIGVASALSPLLFGTARKYKPVKDLEVAKAMLQASQATPAKKVNRYTYQQIMELQRSISE